jgi:hypothetical protein
MVCGVCGASGHNKRTCPSFPKVPHQKITGSPVCTPRLVGDRLSSPLSIHCLSTAYPLPIHCLFLPIHCLLTSFSYYPLQPIHCSLSTANPLHSILQPMHPQSSGPVEMVSAPSPSAASALIAAGATGSSACSHTYSCNWPSTPNAHTAHSPSHLTRQIDQVI